MAVTLILGTVQFQGFEIPEKINFGGEMQEVTHKLPGGSRVINAMGADNDDIEWQGRFRGANAEARARTLDTLRELGTQVELTWSSFFYTVLIKSFKADFMQQYEIPYTIRCRVIADELQLVSQLIPSLGTLLNGDAGNAAALAAGALL